MLEEKQRDGLGSPNDGFYESKREWLGRRHFILAFERYSIVFSFYLLFNKYYIGFCTSVDLSKCYLLSLVKIMSRS